MKNGDVITSTAQSSSRRRRFLQGLAASVPIVGGYVPVAITFGLVVRSFGLTTWDAFLSSLLVFAGSAQFLSIGMYGSAGAVTVAGGGSVGAGGAAGVGTAVGGGSVGAAAMGGAAAAAPVFVWGAGSTALTVLMAQIVVAGWLLNLRHLLMSSVVAHNMGSSQRRSIQSVLAFGITDEVFGVAGLRIAQGQRLKPAYLAGLELGAYAAWVGGSVLGAATGDILPATLRTAMGLTLYALFAALLAGQVRSAHGKRTVGLVVAAAAAAVINMALRGVLGWQAGASFPVAMVVGALVALMGVKNDGSR